jgi:two-component system NtrC family sensor kinase
MKPRILVIDDNPAIHEDFRKILCRNRGSSSQLDAMEAALFGTAAPLGQQSEFEIDSAYQAHEGLARVFHALQEGRPYDMAFVDVRMPPGWDGIEVTPKLWIADPDLHIVLCTAYSDYSWEEMFARIGASDRMYILRKPFDRMEVLQLAHTLTGRRQSLESRKLGPEERAGTGPMPSQAHEETREKLQAEIAELIQSRRGVG